MREGVGEMKVYTVKPPNNGQAFGPYREVSLSSEVKIYEV